MSTQQPLRRLGTPLVLCLAVLLTSVVLAEDEPRVRRGSTQVKFVRLAEKMIGEVEQIALLARPLAGDGQVTFIMGRKNKSLPLARRLKEGQRIAVAWVIEGAGKLKWITRIEVVDGEKREPRPDTLGPDRMRKRIRELSGLLARLKRRIDQLEAENAKLKKQLGGRREKPVRTGGLPDGMSGFSGVLIGIIERKEGRAFSMKIRRVKQTWPHSKAPRPASAVGRTLIFVVPAEAEKLIKALKGLEVGNAATVEAVHREGTRLTVIEELRKGD